MPLLLCYRRYWAVVFFAVLLLPAIGLVAPDLPAPMRTVVAPEARWWEKATQRLDPYINNVFGFRGAVLAAHAAYGRALNTTRERPVIRGEDGALFLKEQSALEQSLGVLVRPDAVARQVEKAQALHDYMRSIGGRFVMMVPPNAHTINFELLPAWARGEKTSPTEYDLFQADMEKRGIPYVDLRALMLEHKKEAPVFYRTDTHWNNRGALIGFNAAMAATGRPDLQVSAEEALGPREMYRGGDLARLLGEENPKPDVFYPTKGPMLRPELQPLPGAATTEKDPFWPWYYKSGHGGPRIMVIGDSYTQYFWAGLLAHAGSEVAWMAHRFCNFDMDALKAFKPDILIYAPAERSLPCGRAKGRDKEA